MGDSITLLTCASPLVLVKTWQADGTIADYDDTKHYQVREVDLKSIDDLSAVLARVERHQNMCAIRGKFVGAKVAAARVPPEKVGMYVRQNVLFDDVPRHWMAIDVDKYQPLTCDALASPQEAIEEFISCNLPNEFHEASYHWQLSNSFGHPSKTGELRAHLWFWLSQPKASAELKPWAKAIGNVDSALYQQIQAHFTGLPRMEVGVVDPIQLRSGFVRKARQEVDLIITDEMLARVRSYDPTHAIDLPDPTEKPGLIGDFCRRFNIDEVLSIFLLDHFEPVTDRRVTWLHGGGTPEGCFITPDRHYLVNIHNTDPADNRAQNAFDLCRIHLFGDLDDPTADDAWTWEIDVTKRPSYQAMVNLAKVELAKAQQDELYSAVAQHRQAIESANDERSLREQVAKAIAEDDVIQDLDREGLAKALQSRLHVVTGVKPGIAIVRDMIAPAVQAGGWRDVDNDGNPLGTIGNVNALINRLNVKVRYNVISKSDEILIPGAAWSLDNGDSAALAMIFSECVRHRLPVSISILRSYITAVADRNPYNPILTWIQSQPWDGKSRVDEWVATLESPMDVALKKVIMLKWAIYCVAILASPKPVMGRGVLVTSGEQYKGKTRWLKSHLPPELQDYIKDGHLLQPSNKDSVLTALGHWIVELGELDATFKRSDIAALKAFLTLDRDQIRKPFAAADSKFMRRTAFYGSVNDEEFLGDLTGNTRFWTVPLTRAVWDHGIDMQQFWAEILVMWEAGAEHFLSDAEMQDLANHNERHVAWASAAEKAATYFDWSEPTDSWVWLSASQIGDLIGLHNLATGDLRAVSARIRKLNGNLHKRTSQARFLAVPSKPAADSNSYPDFGGADA